MASGELIDKRVSRLFVARKHQERWVPVQVTSTDTATRPRSSAALIWCGA